MGKKRTNFDESAMMNVGTYHMYLDRLTELALSMFEWKNLPEEIDERFLELTLFKDGKALFFYDDALGYLTLQCTFNGGFNVYRIPIKRRAYAVNGYQRDLTDKDSVIIYNNYLHTNSVRDMSIYAKRIYNLDRIIDVNANAQKTPVLVQGTEQQRLTLLNLYKEYDGNSPVIFGDKNLDLNSLKSISTGAPYVGDKLYTLKTEIWNEALTHLGISNVNTVKKERMITDEVIRQQGGTIASRYSRLEMRRQACEQINKMFDLDISVEYRADYREADDELMLTGETEDGSGRLMVADLNTDTKFRPKARQEF